MLRLENAIWETPDGDRVINDINIEVGDGKLVVVTGPNGGGKTTLAKLIAGLENLTSGKIIFDGKDITNVDITDRAKMGISYAFQQPVRFKGMTVGALLSLAAGRELTHPEYCALLGKVGLCADEYINRELNASLSGGEIKRIEIASVLIRGTKLSIFDEPEAGIDLWSFSKLVETFENIKKQEHGTLMIISHQERILSIADEIIVIADGKIRAMGEREEILPTLLANERVVRCPLGKEERK